MFTLMCLMVGCNVVGNEPLTFLSVTTLFFISGLYHFRRFYALVQGKDTL